ncbi:MAG: isoprenyl transferase [Candidatus Cloacimonadales bacterium]|jgi:undecaprenyl diphosphate synthase|nr:isoprenyl transferase [Candidatus Cloacimonadota bacterium]MDD3501564.1 isoprenyl transferase [Candidatus Cloacimonadota bacterium]MDX9978168.1 isoprenyl transferase [Candidatus Cloacimonadales bacterium]
MNYKEIIKKLDNNKLPKHIGVIMDGNGRWANKQGAIRLWGHKHGVESVRAIVEASVEVGIKYLTIYAFSTENWTRPEDEVKGLLKLILDSLIKEVDALNKQNIIVRFLGTDLGLSDEYKQKIEKECEKTYTNNGLNFNIAFNYGGRLELLEGIKTIAKQIQENKISLSDIDESIVSSVLYTSGMPDPDLIIRTSGEQRLSNFLIWQSAYAEFYFTDVLWPDFRKKDFVKAILEYQNRQRRYGGSK